MYVDFRKSGGRRKLDAQVIVVRMTRDTDGPYPFARSAGKRHKVSAISKAFDRHNHQPLLCFAKCGEVSLYSFAHLVTCSLAG